MQADNIALLKILKGHKQSITSLDLHPKCRFVASAGLDSNFFLWDLKDQAQPRRFEGHKANIQDLKFHPNGSIIGSASADGAIKLWQLVEDGKQVTLTKAHNSKIRSINFSCDGNLLVSAGDDKNIKIWSTIDRRLQGQYKKHDNWVRYCQFSPISQSLISCDDRMVYIWDVETKKAIQQYKEHAGVIHQARFHSLGNIAASCSHDKKIKLYDLRSRKVVQTYEGHTGPIKSIDFHPHTSHLVSSGQDGKIKIWNFQKSRLQYTIDSPSYVTRFSRQGQYFISAGLQKVVNIWKTGFYDTFKEKINGSEGISAANAHKIKVQFDDNQKVATEQSEQFGGGKQQKADDEQESEEQQNLIYCHEKQNFQLLSNRPAKQKQLSLSGIKIPKTLLNKIHHMNSQLDFITKTTQILQARVMNNGEQLQRLLDMVHIGGQEEQVPENPIF